MPVKHRVCLNLEARQAELIRTVAERAGMGQSELVRRIFDHAMSEQVLNHLIPPMSGRLPTSR